jgi:DNA polymerase-3 subunit alpha
MTPKMLLTKAKELGQTAIAITDHGSIAGAWDGLKASKDLGVKLIIGCEMYFLNDASQKEDRFRHVVLLAKNEVGYKNLLTINKLGYDNAAVNTKVYPLIDWKILEQYSEGLICLTSCANGILSQLLINRQFDEAETQLQRLIGIFGKDNLGLEVQANALKRGANHYHDQIDQVFINNQITKLAKKHGLRAVATTNAHYIDKSDNETHDVLMSIGSHQSVFSNFRMKYDVPDFYVKSGDEVHSFFARNYKEYANELIANSIYFANLCEAPNWIDPKYSNPSGRELPDFPVKDADDFESFKEWMVSADEKTKSLPEDQAYLRFKCNTTFYNKIIKTLPEEMHKVYIDRINEELEVLEYQGFSSYMLIVADYVQWAIKQGISVGPGRGSAAGCYVAYLLGIHKADSIKYGLIFARFQNRLRMEAPDIDQDLSSAGRGKVIEYLINKYGPDHVASISNFNTITPKVYVRDIAKACELGGSKDHAIELGNILADIIPPEIKDSNHFEDLANIPLFAEYSKKYPQLFKFKALMGINRSNSTHAAAIVIGRRPLVGLIPLRKDKAGALVVEYEKKNAEANGLIKMDLLGLSTLDLIDNTVALIRATGREVNPKYLHVDDYDEKTYDLIASGNTFGVFQFGTSAGTIDLCKKVKPKCIEDLAIITTLARPAAKNIREAFIATREGRREFSLLHPSLHNAFALTFGFGLFDESILQVGQDVAGWDMSKADSIRKMIKEKGKNPDKDKKLRQDFIDSTVARGVDVEMATKIWDEEIKKFAGYTFNKAHAVTYSFISYTTAYLKAHYPVEFLLANLMAELNSNAPTAKINIAKIKKEIRSLSIKILPPDLNKSEMSYTMKDDSNLLTGLEALKFVSEDAISDIIEKRPFANFFDFMHRVDSTKVRANTIQALVASGCLDSFGLKRKTMFLYCSDYRKKLTSWLKKHDPSTNKFTYPFPEDAEWDKQELYALEAAYLGEGFSCDKLDAYGTFFRDTTAAPAKYIKSCSNKTQLPCIRGEVKDVFEFKIKKETSKYYGQSMVKAIIEDFKNEPISLTIFPDRWEQILDHMRKNHGNKFKFEPGIALHFAGSVNIYEDEPGIIMERIYNMHPVPQKPTDLKHRKVSMRGAKSTSNGNSNLLDELEDDLYNEGLIDLDNEDLDN